VRVTGADAIRIAGLQKSYGARAVLRGIDLQVERGQLVGLIGPNGAGKSTLLRTLVGLVARNGGDIAVLGLDPARESLAIRRRACYLPGETSVYAQMTGQQFLDFALGFYPRLQRTLLRDLTDLFALPLGQRIRSYSSGMKQKLAVLATLVPDVELYLLDEPDRALDASIRFQLRDVLQRLHRDGKTIVLSSHHLVEVETLADRLEFLLAGELVPTARVAAARRRLQQRLRVRLRDGAAPRGARVLEREADGWTVLETDAEPLLLLRELPPESVLGAEIGVSRLEELYALLLAERAPAAGPAPEDAR
jgi:ABC-2 type transport system ATP-binding protein